MESEGEGKEELSLFSVKEQNCLCSVSLAAIPHPGGDRHISALYLATWGWAKNSIKGLQWAHGLWAAGMGENPGQGLHGDTDMKWVMEDDV